MKNINLTRCIIFLLLLLCAEVSAADLKLVKVKSQYNLKGISNDSLMVIIKNVGQNSISNFNIKVVLRGGITTTIIKPYTTAISSNQIDTINVNGYSTQVNDTILYHVYLIDALDSTIVFDSLSTVGIYFNNPIPDSISNNIVTCKGNVIELTGKYKTGKVFWYKKNSSKIYTDKIYSSGQNDTLYAYTTAYDHRQYLKISEISLGISDGVEIHNISKLKLNTKGWKVIINDNPTNINAVHTAYWNLPDEIEPFSVLYRTESTPVNWGGSIAWYNGSLPGIAGWVIILDNFGVVVDAVFMNWSYNAIKNASIVFQNKRIDISDAWNDNGVNIGITTNNFILRSSFFDSNISDDFIRNNTGSLGTAQNNINPYLALDSVNGPSYMRTVSVVPEIIETDISKGLNHTAYFDTTSKQLNKDAYDFAKVGDTLHYIINAPVGFNNNDFGITWELKNIQLKRSNINIIGQPIISGRGIQYVVTQADFAKHLSLEYQIESPHYNCKLDLRRIILVEKTPSFSIGKDTFICNSDYLELSAKQYNRVVWSTGDTSKSINVYKPGEYYAFAAYEDNYGNITNYFLSKTINVGYKTATINVDLGPDKKPCVGDTVIFDAGPQPLGYKYKWITGDTTRTIKISSAVVGATYDVYVKIIAPNGCIKSDTCRAVFSIFSPKITTSSIIDKVCDNDTLTLSVEFPNGAPSKIVSYEWSTGDTTSSIKITKADTYWVNVVILDGCVVSTQRLIQAVPDTMNAMFQHQFVSQNMLKFSADMMTNLNHITYILETGDGSVLTSNYSIIYHEYDSSGVYTVKLTTINNNTGCKDEYSKVIPVFFDGLNNIKNDNFVSIYPNPFADILSLSFNTKMNIEFEIVDIIGKSHYRNSSKGLSNINLELKLQPGIYFLKVYDNSKVYSYKILKKDY